MARRPAAPKSGDGGDVLLPGRSNEDLSRVRTFELPPITFSVSVEKIPIALQIPKAEVTTNLPVEGPKELSLNESVACLGFSSERKPQNREELEGADARVIVTDYKGYGRVIQVNRPSGKNAHPAQDAQGHTLAVDPEGNVLFGGIIADGNSSVWLPKNLVGKEHTVRKRNIRARQANIVATGSATYADIAARNAMRLPAGFPRHELVADLLVGHTDRNPNYMRTFGGSTVQMLGIKFMPSSETMQAANLNMGVDKDLGSLEIISTEGARGVVSLKGNDQDLSFEGKLPDYDPRTLTKTLRGDEDIPVGAVMMTSDGFLPLPDTLPGGKALLDLLKADPESVVRFFSHIGNIIDKPGNEHDDGSLMVFVPWEFIGEVAVQPSVSEGATQPASARPSVEPREILIPLPVEGETLTENQKEALSFFESVLGVEAFEKFRSVTTVEALENLYNLGRTVTQAPDLSEPPVKEGDTRPTATIPSILEEPPINADDTQPVRISDIPSEDI